MDFGETVRIFARRLVWAWLWEVPKGTETGAGGGLVCQIQ